MPLSAVDLLLMAPALAPVALALALLASAARHQRIAAQHPPQLEARRLAQHRPAEQLVGGAGERLRSEAGAAVARKAADLVPSA